MVQAFFRHDGLWRRRVNQDVSAARTDTEGQARVLNHLLDYALFPFDDVVDVEHGRLRLATLQPGNRFRITLGIATYRVFHIRVWSSGLEPT